jgi:hypothetical protein
LGTPKGKSFSIAVFDQARIKDRRMVEHRRSPDRSARMAQSGLLPQRPQVTRYPFLLFED